MADALACPCGFSSADCDAYCRYRGFECHAASMARRTDDATARSREIQTRSGAHGA